MKTIFKVACIENCAENSLDVNLRTIENLVDVAIEEKPDLICLPEFYCLLEKNDLDYVDEKYSFDRHPALLHGIEMAKKFDCWFVLGSIPVYFDKHKIKNRCVVLNPFGEIAAFYDKIHLFDVSIRDGQVYRESNSVAPGDSAVTVDLPWGCLGLTVCYDVRFAYLYRLLAKSGAHFIAIPAAFTYKTGKAHWHTLIRTRAIETGCYIFAPSQCGTRAWGRRTFGHSLIVDPWGRILAEGKGEQGVISVDIDVTVVDRVRSMIPAIDHDVEINNLRSELVK